MQSLAMQHLSRNPSILYCRYIDDIFICTNTRDELDGCLHILNTAHNSINLTVEYPNDGWLPFLNCLVGIRDNRFITTWYRKPTSKNILIHRRSAHPAHMKRNVLRQMESTAIKLSSTDSLKAESSELARKIAVQNGYDGVQYRSDFCCGCKWERGRVSFQIPFVSDRFTSAVLKIVRSTNLPINLVVMPPPSLRQKLVSSRVYDKRCVARDCIICPTNKPGACARTGCVYRLLCECGESYVGESGRPLHIRIREHMRSFNRPLLRSYVDMPMACHRKERHPDSMANNVIPAVQVIILANSNSTVRRRVLEATHIQLINPSINKRDELVEALRYLE